MILAACESCRTVKLDPEPTKITDENRQAFFELSIVENPHGIVVYCDACERWRQFILFDPTASPVSNEKVRAQ